jgi:sugar lactone lactonase YvrE
MKRILTMAIVLCALPAAAVAAQRSGYPETIPLPNNWQPEGIATDGNTFFAGSRATGSIWRGNLKTDRGEPLVTRTDGAALGMKVDERNRLFVAGGGTGTARVYDADDGDLLREYLLTPAPTFVNDVTVTKKAAYFTDSQRQQLYVVDLDRKRLPRDARTLPLTGDLQYDTDPETFELNGIAATRNGKRLIAVQSGVGKLFAIDPRSGDTDEIELDGAPVTNGDGLLLDGRLLYVVQNVDNRIVVVKLDRDLDEGSIVRYLTDDDFDVPTTLAEGRPGGYLWAVNARFTTTAGPDTTYDVVRVSR